MYGIWFISSAVQMRRMKSSIFNLVSVRAVELPCQCLGYLLLRVFGIALSNSGFGQSTDQIAQLKCNLQPADFSEATVRCFLNSGGLRLRIKCAHRSLTKYSARNGRERLNVYLISI